MMTPLKAHREKQQLTSRKVALDLSIAPSHYRRIEIGVTTPSAETANRIARYFHNRITRDQILFPEDYPPLPAKPVRLQEAR